VSLKTFHFIFIGASFLLALFFAGWGANQYFAHTHRLVDLLVAVLSLGAAVGLIFYGRYFRKKLKNIDYL
jgi:hypothetical protein